jgi:hypothetical protein
MQNLNLRLNSASELTYSQLDLNFKRIKAAVDALEISVAGAGLGTVTSVGLSLPNIFTVTNSPVTTTGSLTATLVPQNGNLVFSSPNGTSGQPTFRSLVVGDLPNITIAKGGTGLTALPLNNQVLVSNGVGYEGRTISVGLGLTLTQGTGSINLQVDSSNINLTSLGGVLTSNQGGTGISSTPANGELLIGNGTVWQKATLTAGSGINITNGAGSITISTSASGVSSLNGLGGLLALGVGTTGTDVNVTTPTANDIRINIPTASATNRGVLTASDWTVFNAKVTGSGTAGKIPIFSSTNAIQDSFLTYSTPPLTGKLTFASGTSGANIEAVGGVSSEIRASGSGGTRITYISADASVSTLGWTNGQELNFQQGSDIRGFFNPNGTLCLNNGFAIAGFTYYNTAAGSSTSIANNGYGVIIGGATASAVTVALPSLPEDGQEVVIAVEANRTITVTSSRAIFGINSGVGIVVNVTGGSAGAATLILKYSTLGNSGAGAWYITGL